MKGSIKEGRTRKDDRIVLEMTPTEFAVLDGLRWFHLAGHSGLRSSIEAGFDDVHRTLEPDDRFASARNRIVKTRASGKIEGVIVGRG